MVDFYTGVKKIIFIVIFIFPTFTVDAQLLHPKRIQPKWWVGQSVAGNFNQYTGSTRILDNQLTVPTAFGRGNGLRLYASILTEYRPNKVFGLMLNVAFSNQSSSFDSVFTPVNTKAFLYNILRYISFEPSIRIAPFSSGFYVFGGPTVGIRMKEEYFYLEEQKNEKHGNFSAMRKFILGAQLGAGLDIPISKKTSANQITISPFVSYIPKIIGGPRSIETWNIHIYRAGVAFKFGTKKITSPLIKGTNDTMRYVRIDTFYSRSNNLAFSVRAPKVVSYERDMQELFPLRNSIFFDAGANSIPSRYIRLTQNEATAFQESQLKLTPSNLVSTDRSARQLLVYHNILNIMGDRLRANTNATISLVGSSASNAAEGKVFAENIKDYLVSTFQISPTRITTSGNDKPYKASLKPDGKKELALLSEEDRRVDITSNSPELFMQVGDKVSSLLKPVVINAVQTDPLDSHVIFNVDGATQLLSSWALEIKDEQGRVQNYGPFTNEKTSIAGKEILGSNAQGNYTVVMVGQLKDGTNIRKESSVSLMKTNSTPVNGLRFSILFDFDESKTVASYENFLKEMITPYITDNSTVIIHGHTDIIGEEMHNVTLSLNRAKETQQILESALANAGKKGIRFERYGFGKNQGVAPFENNLPEQRFYNRTVIIDIIQQ